MLAEKINATEALRLGLVDHVVDEAGVSAYDVALAWAYRIAGNSRASVRSFLALDRAWRGGDGGNTVVAAETRLFGELWGGEDFQRVLDDWRDR